MGKKFDKPIGEWIEEEIQIPVMTPVVNEKKGRVEFKQRMTTAITRTMYSDNKPRVVICKNHFFLSFDKKKCIFRCRRCNYHKIAYPVTYRFNQQTGKLTHKETKITV